MHKPESVPANETDKFHWDFEIKTDPLILPRRQEIVFINIKKKKKKEIAV